MLQTASQVIDALGGTGKVAEMLGVGASAISNYRRDGFPAAKHYQLAKACEMAGLAVDQAVFGGAAAARYNTPHYETPRHDAHQWRGTNENQGAKTDPLARLREAGFTPVSTPMIQPAAPFIDRMGPEMQGRLYSFTDPGGEQLCLRPDLTIPAALYYLKNDSGNDSSNNTASGSKKEARYCYQGTAFRYQPRGAGKPEEFTQLGIEILNGRSGPDALADDIDVITRILGLIEDAGIAGYEIYFNDFDLFRFFIDSLDMSPGTAGKIRTCFEQATDIDDFRRRAKPRPFTLPDGVMLTGNNDMVAGRSMTEIKDRLAQKQLDTERSAEDADKVERLTAFLRFFSTPVSWNKLPEQFPEMQDYVQTRTRNLGESLIPEIANIMSGFDLDRLFFSPAFGRKMAYYTGLSFEIHVPRLGPRRVIAAGGRYDDLLFSLGAPTDTPAVGGAVSLERLQEAATTQASIEATIEGASS